MSEPRFITAAGVGTLLGVSRRRAYQLIETEGFPTAIDVDTGGKRPLLIFDRKAVLKWKDARR